MSPSQLETILSALRRQVDEATGEVEVEGAGVTETDLPGTGDEEVFRTLNTGEFEPQYVANHKHNLANNILRTNLPEDVLYDLADFLYPETLHNLRSSSSFILRLLSDKKRRSEPWVRGLFAIWPKGGDRGREGADYDQSCAKCREFRGGDDFEAVRDECRGEMKFCEGCYEEHPGIEFPGLDEENGRCVRWTGKVEVCEHLGFSLENAMQSTVFEDEGALECPHHGAPVTVQVSDGSVTVRFVVLVMDLGPSEPVTKKALAEHLSAIDPQSLGLRFCSHVKPGDGQLLLPFGPDLCACFEGKTWIPHDPDHSTPSERPDMVPDCCRCRGEAMPGMKGQFMPREEQLCHQYPCSRCLTTYSWAREGRRASLIVTRQMPIVSDPLDPKWPLNLDPESMGFRDERLRHLVWCDEEGCQTGGRWAKLMLMWGAPVSHGCAPAEEAEEAADAAADGIEGGEAQERTGRKTLRWIGLGAIPGPWPWRTWAGRMRSGARKTRFGRETRARAGVDGL